MNQNVKSFFQKNEFLKEAQLAYGSTCLVEKQCKRSLNLFCSQAANLNVAPCNANNPYNSTMSSISPYQSYTSLYPLGYNKCDCGYTQYYAGPTLGCGIYFLI